MRFNEIRKIKVFMNITFADISDTTGVAIFVKEVIGAGVIAMIVFAAIFTAYKAYRKSKKNTGEGPPQHRHYGGPHHHLVKANFWNSPCYG